MQNFFCLLTAMMGFSVASYATTPQVWRGPEGMPRCLSPAGNPEASGRHVLIYWNYKDSYRRKIYMIPIVRVSNRSGFPRGQAGGFPTCADWARLNSFLDLSTLSNEEFLWSEGSLSAQGYDLDPLTIDGLQQISRGGEAYRTERTAAEYLTNHPIVDYTGAVNAALTKKFGIGFTAEIFQAWLRQKPRNQAFRQRLRSTLKQSPAQVQAAINSQLKDVLLLIAPGYLEDPHSSRVDVLMEDLRSLGLPIRKARVSSTAGSDINSRQLAEEIAQEIQNGRRLILMGASKGAAEMMTASAMLNQQGRLREDRLLGIINISGTLHGSFLVDYVRGLIGSPLAAAIIAEEARRTGLPIEPSVQPGFLSQSSKFLSQNWATWARYLPKRPLIVDMVGILGKDGFAPKDGFIYGMQSRYVDSFLFPKFAANDGFLTYPNMMTPDSWGLNSVQLDIDSSHTLTDGSVEGLILNARPNRQRLMLAFLQACLENAKR